MKSSESLLIIKNLEKQFTYKTRLGLNEILHAVKPCSFEVKAKQTLAIIGENGSGKSTLAKMIVGMVEPTAGEISIGDKVLEFGDYSVRSQLIRMIYQDPAASLNPQQRVGEILDMTLELNTNFEKKERLFLIQKTLKQVGLLAEHAQYYPSMLAAGQKQRVAMARAIILQPMVIIADEPLASLDMPIRAQIINLMLELQEKEDITFIYVTQDIEIMKHISDYVVVMHEGEVIELGTLDEIVHKPQHPITQKLMNFEVPSL
ncbi:ATP-binding cassette domain-containing protein [Thorsellia kenyensis]|uniref:ATP-binding cassette domain-containing protein n=1 Tax=Thorsellia kenyensis TaxID=1549888 RepID=A0ABV6C7V6_9GAMM